jgi:hypothetical protein
MLGKDVLYNFITTRGYIKEKGCAHGNASVVRTVPNKSVQYQINQYSFGSGQSWNGTINFSMVWNQNL